MNTDYCNCKNVTSVVITETGFICGECGRPCQPLSDEQKKVINSLASNGRNVLKEKSSRTDAH